MVAAITARSGSATVVEAKTAVHIEVTGAEDTVEPTASGTITANSLANPTSVTAAAHGLTTGDSVTIAGSNSTPSINGTHTVTRTGVNTFTIPINVTVAGTAGTWTLVTDAGSNERRYYILVDAPSGTDDARSVVFSPSADGKFTWDDYIFPQDGSYTLRLRDQATNADVATAAVTVQAAA